MGFWGVNDMNMTISYSDCAIAPPTTPHHTTSSSWLKPKTKAKKREWTEHQWHSIWGLGQPLVRSIRSSKTFVPRAFSCQIICSISFNKKPIKLGTLWVAVNVNKYAIVCRTHTVPSSCQCSITHIYAHTFPFDSKFSLICSHNFVRMSASICTFRNIRIASLSSFFQWPRGTNECMHRPGHGPRTLQTQVGMVRRTTTNDRRGRLVNFPI